MNWKYFSLFLSLSFGLYAGEIAASNSPVPNDPITEVSCTMHIVGGGTLSLRLDLNQSSITADMNGEELESVSISNKQKKRVTRLIKSLDLDTFPDSTDYGYEGAWIAIRLYRGKEEALESKTWSRYFQEEQVKLWFRLYDPFVEGMKEKVRKERVVLAFWSLNGLRRENGLFYD